MADVVFILFQVAHVIQRVKHYCTALLGHIRDYGIVCYDVTLCVY